MGHGPVSDGSPLILTFNIYVYRAGSLFIEVVHLDFILKRFMVSLLVLSDRENIRLV